MWQGEEYETNYARRYRLDSTWHRSSFYNRITYTTKEKIVDIGPIEATADKEKTIPLPPLLGGLALIAGVGLIAVGYRK